MDHGCSGSFWHCHGSAIGAISLVYPSVYSFASVGAMILFFNLLGKYLESSAKKRAAKSIRALLDLRPQTARIIVDGIEVEIPVQQLDPGDIMVVRPGERIPTDGILLEGECYVDESMIRWRIHASAKKHR